MVNVLKSMQRCKSVNAVAALSQEKKLKKVLTLLDLVALGIGSTLGVGIYLLPGNVARNIAGPSVVLSFLIAAIVSAFAGLSFAEFGSRAPTAGSAYTYCYLTLGEFVAFSMGWNLIMQYLIGAASVARALSVYFDSFLCFIGGNCISSLYTIHIPIFSAYFDLMSLVICAVFAVALATGLKESVLLNNFVTGLNVLVVIFVTVAGSLYVDVKNWSLPSIHNKEYGSGGFFPYGIEGTIKGAGACFYGFIGFDCIATTGEEVKNPQRSLPLAIIISLIAVWVAYMGVSVVLTLILPYYLQDEIAPLSYALEVNGCHWAKWLINAGAMFGLYASFFGAFYPITRIIYAMANDGLLHQSFGKVHHKYETPFIATLFSGLVTGVIGGAFDVDELINLNAISTLLTYTSVAACVIVLRYTNLDTGDEESSYLLPGKDDPQQSKFLWQLLFNRRSHYQQSSVSENIVVMHVLTFSLLCGLVSLVMINSIPMKVPIVVFLICLMTLQLFSIKAQPEYSENVPFKVPLVPFLPAISMFLNIYLMMTFDSYTWIRFMASLVIGLFVYFGYGMFNSNERTAV